MNSVTRSLLALLVIALGCSQRSDPKQELRFEDLARQSIEARFAFSPSFATYMGFHRFDDSLENWTPEAIGAEKDRCQRVLEGLKTIDPRKLDRARRIDFELFRNEIEGTLFRMTEIRSWETDPGEYNYGFMLESMIARNYAPPEDRLRSLSARLRMVGRQLANARTNLKNPPRMLTEFATDDFEGTISYLEKDVTHAFKAVNNPTLLAEFERSKKDAIQATERHVRWMRETLLPASNGSYILGEDRYRKKLRYEEMINLPIDTLLAVGGRELSRLEMRYQEAAARILPARPVEEVVAMMRLDHAPVDSLLGDARALIEDIRAFCISSNFIEIPSEVRCQLRPTPEYAASRSFASFDGPGPLETKAKEAFYNITLPDKRWPKERVEQHLQGFSRWSLPSVSIHEVYPGHYTHFLYARDAPSFVRKTMGCGSFAEGWGLYTEEGLLDQGYGGGDPRIEFGVMRWALVRACRLQVGIRVHTRGMPMEEATRFFMDHAGLERENAEREAGRAAFDPTYSVYTLGALEIRKLRDDVARAQGSDFNLARFHATILSQGSLPVALLRRMLLPREGSIL